MAPKGTRLGKNVDALMAGAVATANQAPQQNVALPTTSQQEFPVEWLQRGRFQPRRDMHPDALKELSESIRAQGLLQPIVVRAVAHQKYEILAGERRWRAAQMANMEKVPVIVRDVPDEAAMAIALIENIQREDLNPLEEAIALHRLGEEFTMTHQEIASAVGKSRSSISNLLRLLALNEDVKRLLECGDIEMGHGRALLALTGHKQSEAAKVIVEKGLSVRETEEFIRRLQTLQPKQVSSKQAMDPDVQRLQSRLAERIGAAVKIQHNSKGKGKLVIQYNSLDELDGILRHMGETE